MNADPNEASLSTRMIHADPSSGPDIAVPLHVSTTFAYSPDHNTQAALAHGLIDKIDTETTQSIHPYPPSTHIYSRESAEVRSRLETVLGALETSYAVTYSSGLAATYACLIHVQPRRILMSRQGYHGTHGSISLYMRSKPSTLIMHIEDDDGSGDLIRKLESSDMIWIESPQNPRGEVADLEYYAKHKADGVVLAVDSTLAPPPLQQPMNHGADIVMHSSTKYLGGHSDLLGGVLMTRSQSVHKQLLVDRSSLGSVMGSMESWLLLRSMRTYDLRIHRQSDTASRLALWLNTLSRNNLSIDHELSGIVDKVYHASIPGYPGYDASKRQGTGYSGVLSIDFTSHQFARLICKHLQYFYNATSLGGCESLIEWRFALDTQISPNLCRLSIGLESFDDLQRDLICGFKKVKKMINESLN